MINYNGKIIEGIEPNLLNRGFLYGDCVFGTIKVIDNKIIFWEDHYLRLMSSLRIIRVEIPINYTPEFFESQIENTFNKLILTFREELDYQCIDRVVVCIALIQCFQIFLFMLNQIQIIYLELVRQIIRLIFLRIII